MTTAIKPPQLTWPTEPTLLPCAVGAFNEWRAGDYRVTSIVGSRGRYVCWTAYIACDNIDDRYITGWRPIGDDTTLAAAMRRCQNRAGGSQAEKILPVKKKRIAKIHR